MSGTPGEECPGAKRPGDGPPIRIPYIVLALGLITFAMGQTILFAVLGPLGRMIGLSEIQVGGMVSIAAVVIAFVSPWWGRRSDEWGRRAVMAAGLLAYGITMLMFSGVIHLGTTGILAAGLTFWLMVSVRIVYALLTAGIQPAATAYIADSTSGADRAAGLAMVGAAFGFGSVLGPAFGAGLSYFGLLVPLNGVAVLALVSSAAVWFLLPKGRRVERGAVKRLRLRDPRIAPFLLLMLAALTIGAGAQQTAAFYIQDLFGLTPHQTARRVGVIMAASALALLVAQGLIVQTIKPRPAVLIQVGLAIGTVGFTVLVLAQGFSALMVGYVIIGFAIGFLNPGLMAAASLSVNDDEQGAIAGLMGSAMSGGFILGPVLGTWLYGFSPHLPFLASAIALVILLAITFFIPVPRYGRGPRLPGRKKH